MKSHESFLNMFLLGNTHQPVDLGFFHALKWLGLSSELTYGRIGTDQKHEQCPILAGLVGLNLKVATGDNSRIPMYPH